jgi:hypothetical protein
MARDCGSDSQEKEVTMAHLNAAERRAIPRGKFGVPSKAPGSGSYPLNDKKHAIDALSRSSGKPVAARIRRKVAKLYPGIHQDRGKLQGLASAMGR